LKRRPIFFVLMSLLTAFSNFSIASEQGVRTTPTPKQKEIKSSLPKQAVKVAANAESQGLSPFDIELTKDGQYAYLGFDLSEVIFKVRLTDLAIVASADLSSYFPMESENIALDASEKKLFVYARTWRKLLVLDTDTMSLVHTIDDIGIIGMVRSQFGARLMTWGGGGTVKFVDTDTYAETQVELDDLFI
jgi:hypothetical protein